MFLEYGVNAHGEFVHVSQSPRGRVQLACPYCGQSLIARKGSQLAHHFAHDGDTCRESERDFDALSLPIYDRFHVHLSPTQWEDLQAFHAGSGHATDALWNADAVRDGFGRYAKTELTDKGKIPFGEATLLKFADFQSGKVYARHNELQQTVQNAAFGRGTLMKPQPDMVAPALADLNIYRAQVRRLYSLTLYLLQVDHKAGTLFKIGVTARDIAARIDELERDLKPFVTAPKITPLRLLTRRGAVERYALHRYRDHAVSMGNLTEYFAFDKKQAANVKRDFTALGDFYYIDEHDERSRASWGDRREYNVPGLISDIVDGLPSEVERAIVEDRERKAAEHREAQRIEAIKEGMQRAADEGVHVGRPTGTHDSAADTLAKYPDVVQALQDGLSLRKAASATGVSVNTVRKVKAAMNG